MKNDKNNRIEFIIEKLFMANELNYKQASYDTNTQPKKSGWKLFHIDIGDSVKREFLPDHPWLYNFGTGIDDPNDDNLIALHTDYLIKKPQEIITDSFEFLVIKGSEIIWTKHVKTDIKKLKHISAPFAKAVYETHQRSVNILGGEGLYGKNISACNSGGDIPIYYGGKPVNQEGFGELTFACSIKEHFYKLGVFHVQITKVSTGAGIKMAVDSAAISELMRFRTDPLTSKGNKKPVIHWVSKHARKTAGNSSVRAKVKSYIRGLGEFEIDGYKFSIKEPDVLCHEFGTDMAYG